MKTHRSVGSLPLAPLFVLAALGGCGSTTEPDGGLADGGTDGGVDAHVQDAGAQDAGALDAAADAGTPDAAILDGEHLLVSEIFVTESDLELVEIWNPTGEAIALDDYYVSDNAAYFEIADGTPWAQPGTDFLARFPAGTMIAPGAVLVIAADPALHDIAGQCADLMLHDPTTCDGSAVPAMVPAEAGSIPATSELADDAEMLILFRWSGVVGEPVVDVDYVAWGATSDATTRVDKTDAAGYQPDTPAASQRPAPALTSGYHAYVRCGGEVDETDTGGNGVAGHDETSEDLAAAFQPTAAVTPGAHEGCP